MQVVSGGYGREVVLAKCSSDTALRDITDLLDRKILIKEGAGGRSTGYRLVGDTM